MKPLRLLTLLAALASAPGLALAQQAAAAPAAEESLSPRFFVIALGVMVGILALLVLVLLSVVAVLVDFYTQEKTGYSPLGAAGKALTGWLPDLSWDRMVALKPAQGKEASFDQDLGHDYDGITELDNGAPPLFNYIFYGTISFAVIYLIGFAVLDWKHLDQNWELAEEERVAAVQAAEYAKTAANAVDENTVVALTAANDLAAGQALFVERCAACHGAEGQGGIGPNLTDAYWIHGGGIQNVFRTVKYGVPDKGMIAWNTQLSPAQMAQVSSFILTLEGTKPANPKPPQGQVWKAATDSTAATPHPADHNHPGMPADSAQAVAAGN